MTENTSQVSEELGESARPSENVHVSRLVDWLTAGLLILGGLVVATAGAGVYALRDRSRVAGWVADGRLTSTELTDAELIDTTVALLTWGGVGLTVTGGLLVVGGAWFFRARRRRRAAVTTDGAPADVVTLAIVGGVVTVVTSFVPLSPVLGGVVAGYLGGGDRRRGLRVGAYAGLAAAAPFALLTLFLLGGTGIVTVELGLGGVGLFVALAVLVSTLVSVAYLVGLSAAGGYLGVALGEREHESEPTTA